MMKGWTVLSIAVLICSAAVVIEGNTVASKLQQSLFLQHRGNLADVMGEAPGGEPETRAAPTADQLSPPDADAAAQKAETADPDDDVVEPKRIYPISYLRAYQMKIAERIVNPAVFTNTVNRFNTCNKFLVAPVMADAESVDFVLAEISQWIYANPVSGQPVKVGDTYNMQTSMQQCDEMKVVSTYTEDKHDSMMALIHWKQRNALVVVVRGSPDTKAWLLKMNYFKIKCRLRQGQRCGKLHSDTFFAYKLLTKGNVLIKDIAAASKVYGVDKIYFTGHSAGGAIASVAAVDTIQVISTLNTQVSTRTTIRQAHVATFGSPKMCDSDHRNFVKRNLCKPNLLWTTWRNFVMHWQSPEGGVKYFDQISQLPNVNHFVSIGNPVDMPCSDLCGGAEFSPYLTHASMSYVMTLAKRNNMKDNAQCPYTKLKWNGESPPPADQDAAPAAPAGEDAGEAAGEDAGEAAAPAGDGAVAPAL